jgi:hypothetical protein
MMFSLSNLNSRLVRSKKRRSGNNECNSTISANYCALSPVEFIKNDNRHWGYIAKKSISEHVSIIE